MGFNYGQLPSLRTRRSVFNRDPLIFYGADMTFSKRNNTFADNLFFGEGADISPIRVAAPLAGGNNIVLIAHH